MKLPEPPDAPTHGPAPTPSERALLALGWAATVTAIAMYVSYVDQIHRNLLGEKGSVVQPAATVLNCVLWCAYGLLRPKRDWPIVVANLPGVALGAAAFITAL